MSEAIDDTSYFVACALMAMFVTVVGYSPSEIQVDSWEKILAQSNTWVMGNAVTEGRKLSRGD